MKEALCKAFCDDLAVRNVPAGLAVSTAFGMPDGDKIGFYIVTDKATGSFGLQDAGLLLPMLEAHGLDRKSKARAEALQDLLAEYGVDLDEDAREFRISGISSDEVPAKALRFVAFLLRAQDLLLLVEERVANTFREDVRAKLEEIIGSRAVIQDNVPLDPALSEFTPDFVVRADGRPPVGVYLGTSDARILEALFVHMRAEHEAKVPCSIVALLENEKSASAKVRQQAVNRLSAMPIFRGDEVESVRRIAKEVTGGSGAVH